MKHLKKKMKKNLYNFIINQNFNEKSLIKYSFIFVLISNIIIYII